MSRFLFFTPMKLFFLNFLKEFKAYLSGAGKNILFTSLFYSLWFVITYIESVSFDLKNFDGRMIGFATFCGFDIGARVSLFYQSLFIFLSALSIIYLTGYFINRIKDSLINSVEIRIMNYCSLAGIFFYLFHLYNIELKKDLYHSEINDSLEIIYLLHKIMPVALLIRFLFAKNKPGFISIPHYGVILSISFALCFIITDTALMLGAEKAPDYLGIIFITAILQIVSLRFFFSKYNFSEQRDRLDKLTWIWLPLSVSPLISILKDEIFLILKGKQFHLQNQAVIYFILLFVLLIFVFFRYKKSNKNTSLQPVIAPTRLLATKYFPLLIFSTLCYTFYHHYIENMAETFESGNKYLPIMEFRNWGVIPVFEKLNSHVFSDFFFSSFYVFFNGMHGNEIELYDFFNDAITGVLFYYLIYYITRNPYLAFFTILFFPFYYGMCPNEHPYAILGIFALFKVIEKKPSLKNYMLFFITIIFLLLWRIDVGFACLVIIPLLFILYNIFNKRTGLNFKLFAKGFGIVTAVLFLSVLFISIVRGTNIFEKALYAVNYLSSAQTYGYNSLGDMNSQDYKMHYFIFPTIVILITLGLFAKFRILNKTRPQRLAFLSLIFICAYYIVNFQRGLVRHSLFEGIDTFISSFVFIIMATAAYVFLYRKSQQYKFILFCVISFFTLTSYKYPNTKGSKPIFESTAQKLNLPAPNLNEMNTRTVNDTNRSDFENIIHFLKTNLDSNETFVDFNNMPMLYYYSEKITPSYFYQNPICSHNDFLQKRFIKDLDEYNAPYLIFSRVNDQFNKMDNVPNWIRHYKIAEYLYWNYQPHVIVDNFCVWKKNNENPSHKNKEVYKYEKEKTQSDSANVIKARINTKAGMKYLVKMVSSNPANLNLIVNSNNNPVFTPTPFYTDEARTTGYCIIDIKGKNLSFELKDKNNIKEFTITECEYIPDYLSGKFVAYDLIKLPYIWGKYDKELKSEKILFENNEKLSPDGAALNKINIPKEIDRSTGNTIVITLKNESGKDQKLSLSLEGENGACEAGISFDAVVSATEENYAVRISSIYNWHTKNISSLILSAPPNSGIKISRLQITKGK